MTSNRSETTPSAPTQLGPGCTWLRTELSDLKVVGAEEHCSFPDLLQRIPNQGAAAHIRENTQALLSHPGFTYVKGRLDNLGEQRMKDMDEGGIASQVLSFSGMINSTFMEPQAGLELAREINDRLKKAADTHSKRLFPLAELPFHAPELAIEELHRCVGEMSFVGAMLSGSVGGTGRFLDDPTFDPILSAFEELDVPLYLHPGFPPNDVVDTYYTIPGNPTLTACLASGGWGWHSEVAIHVLRLAVSGTLDRHPRLKIVVGHSGEMMPPMLQRFDAMFHPNVFGLKRSVGEMLRAQVWLSISGVFHIPPNLAAIQTWGVDRILFGNDYPYVDSQCVPAFLKALNDVVAPSDMRKICQTNAEELFKIRL